MQFVSRELKEFYDIPNANNNTKYKLVLKPNVGSGSKGIKYFESQNALEHYIHANTLDISKFLIEDYFDGVGVGAGGFFLDGRLIASACHRRIAEWPISGGSSTYRKSLDSQEFQLALMAVGMKFNWSGFLMLEGKMLQDGRIRILEANPRVWGGINNLLSSNSNSEKIASAIFSYLCENRNSSPRISSQIKCNLSNDTYSNPLFYFSTIMYLFKRKRYFRQLLKVYFTSMDKKSDINPFSDFRGWLGQML
jgi:hypothetical protein